MKQVSAYLADCLEFGHQQRQKQKQNPSPAREKFRKLKKDSIDQTPLKQDKSYYFRDWYDLI